jgi:hypothetical protein
MTLIDRVKGVARNKRTEIEEEMKRWKIGLVWEKSTRNGMTDRIYVVEQLKRVIASTISIGCAGLTCEKEVVSDIDRDDQELIRLFWEAIWS